MPLVYDCETFGPALLGVGAVGPATTRTGNGGDRNVSFWIEADGSEVPVME